MIFSGSHDSSAIAVQNKKVDAAAIADRILDAAVSKGLVKREDLVEVWKSEPIPESPTVWRKDLPADLKTRVQAAFLQVKDIPGPTRACSTVSTRPTTRPTTSSATRPRC